MKIAIVGADVLTSTGWVKDSTVLIEEGVFASVERLSIPKDAVEINASGLQMLPGIVDIHGDAFERSICPRVGTSFSLPIAIAENERNLIAAGITTFFYSITNSYEPGLRSQDTARNIINFITGERKKNLLADGRIHIRHEKANTEGYDELCDWIETGKVHLLSLNDHLPFPGDEKKKARHLNSLQRRLKISEQELKKILALAQTRREKGARQTEQLVDLAHKHNIPLASHDDDTLEKVMLSAKRQVTISEFPTTTELASKARHNGASVLMGAPNLVRGGSHLGNMSVIEAVESKVIDCLCSDYHYPSLFHAPFILSELGLMPFEEAWELVSIRPAIAAKIDDRKGKIAPGFDAYFVLVQPNNPFSSAINSVYVAGVEVARYSQI